MPYQADEMTCLRADNAGLRAENAEFRAENAELRRKVEGMEGAVMAMRILLEKSQPLPPDHVPDPDAALRHAEPAGQA